MHQRSVLVLALLSILTVPLQAQQPTLSPATKLRPIDRLRPKCYHRDEPAARYERGTRNHAHRWERD